MSPVPDHNGPILLPFGQKAIQDLAGHKDLITTQRYMHLSPAALKDAIRLLDQQGPAEAGHYVRDPRTGSAERVLVQRRGLENFGDRVETADRGSAISNV